MAADPRLDALLELERRGDLTPAASQMLQAYRAQGVSKTKSLGPGGTPLAANQDVLETAKDRDTARSAMDLIGRVQPQLARVRDLYNHTLKGSGPLKSLKEFLPSQENGQFDRAAAQLQVLVRPATRTPGEGSMSDFESKLALQAVPGRWSMDGSNEEAIAGLQRFLDNSRANYSKRLGLPAAPPKKAPAASGWTIQEAD